MCGIAAFFGTAENGAQQAQLDAALAALSHRGPDGCATAASGRALLAHARLAIIDVQNGAQPMRAEDPRFVLVCNGEIYNHAQLREQLLGLHDLRSRSDSEVIVHLYEDVGPDCTRALDGMFAFFVSDGEHFTAARDALGIKPLYIGWNLGSRGLWFASELKALADHCDGFMALPPGSYLTERGGVRRWFTPSWVEQVGRAPLASPLELSARLEAAVVKRLMSDVPVGVFLSGGLDSSIVAALACQHREQIETFAVGFPGAADLDAANAVAEALGTTHREYVYSVDEVAAVLPQVIYHLESYDPALIRSAIPCYFLAKLASETVKVVLTGEGADELFGGYDYFGGMLDPVAFHRECVRLLLNLHSMNLQRVDRMTMAHGLEGRVPFLDTEFVAWSMGLDPRLKVWEAGKLEKGLLRTAFEGRLPAQILRRRKLEFSAGSGAEGVLSAYASGEVTDHDFARAGHTFPIDVPATKEELLYRRIFEQLFPGPWARANVQRWRGHGGENGAASARASRSLGYRGRA